jgi:type 1 glutamine amidotransferase
LPHNALLISAGIRHPPWLGRYWLRRALDSLPGFNFHRLSSLEKIPILPLDQYQGMVLYFHQQWLSAPALEAFDRYVHTGGGILAIHSATASFKDEPRYFDILGGQFREHGPIQSFQVEPCLPKDEIFGDVKPFTVRDELYRHEYDHDNQVHFYAMVDDEQEPIVWTRPYGCGRVCYCALGHQTETIRQAEVQVILQRGFIWACSREASEKGTS